LLIGVAWVGCGIVAFVTFTVSWKLIPAVVFVGIGLLWIRGAVNAAVRQDRDSS